MRASLFVFWLETLCLLEWVCPLHKERRDIGDAVERSIDSIKKGEAAKNKAKEYVAGNLCGNDAIEYLRNEYRNYMSDFYHDFIDPLKSFKDSLRQSVTEGSKLIDASSNDWFGVVYHTFPNSYVILMEVPGIPISELSVTFTHDVVVVKGDHQACVEEEAESLCLDRSVYRSFRVPFDTEKDKINATVKDGVLVIRMPRQESSRKQVEVKEIDVLKKGLKDRIKSSIGL